MGEILKQKAAKQKRKSVKARASSLRSIKLSTFSQNNQKKRVELDYQYEERSGITTDIKDLKKVIRECYL